MRYTEKEKNTMKAFGLQQGKEYIAFFSRDIDLKGAENGSYEDFCNEVDKLTDKDITKMYLSRKYISDLFVFDTPALLKELNNDIETQPLGYYRRFVVPTDNQTDILAELDRLVGKRLTMVELNSILTEQFGELINCEEVEDSVADNHLVFATRGFEKEGEGLGDIFYLNTNEKGKMYITETSFEFGI